MESIEDQYDTIYKLMVIANQTLAQQFTQNDDSSKKQSLKQCFDWEKENQNSNITATNIEESVTSKVLNIQNLELFQKRILEFRPNFVTVKRKDELFKRLRKEQEQIILRIKRKAEKQKKGSSSSCVKNGEIMLKFKQQQCHLTITPEDLSKLLGEEDLNDVIVEGYLKIIRMKLLPPSVASNTFIYSSYFIEKLLDEYIKEDYYFNQKQIQNFSQFIDGKIHQNYSKVRKWTKKVDIFSMKYLVIPINAFKHWNCLIVVNPKCLITNQPGYMLYCDSMFEKRMFFIEAVKTYLLCEIKQKKGIQISNQKTIPSYQLLLPRQTNSHDCGLYLLAYVQFLLSNYELTSINFQKKDKNFLRLFPRSVIFTMRERLRRLFISLINEPTKQQKILQAFRQERQLILKEAQEEDFDKINTKQLEKYEKMVLSNIQQHDNLDEKEHKYCCLVKFYLDSQVNFYQKDRI